MNNQNSLFPKVSKINTFSKTLTHISMGDFPETEMEACMIDFDKQQESLDFKEALAIRKLHTADSINNNNNTMPTTLNKPDYEPTNVLLLKGVPYDSSEFDVINLVRRFGTIIDLYLVRHKQYAYVHFREIESAMKCHKTFSMYKPQLKKSVVHVCFTGKWSIVKIKSHLSHHTSRFLLLTFQRVFIQINEDYIYQILSPYGNCIKVYIFQSKLIQALVEMEDIGEAMLIKQNLDGAIFNEQAMINVLYMDQSNFLEYEQQQQFQQHQQQHQHQQQPQLPYYYPQQQQHDIDNTGFSAIIAGFHQMSLTTIGCGSLNCISETGTPSANNEPFNASRNMRFSQQSFESIPDEHISHSAYLVNNIGLSDNKPFDNDNNPTITNKKYRQIDQSYHDTSPYFQGTSPSSLLLMKPNLKNPQPNSGGRGYNPQPSPGGGNYNLQPSPGGSSGGYNLQSSGSGYNPQLSSNSGRYSPKHSSAGSGGGYNPQPSGTGGSGGYYPQPMTNTPLLIPDTDDIPNPSFGYMNTEGKKPDVFEMRKQGYMPSLAFGNGNGNIVQSHKKANIMETVLKGKNQKNGNTVFVKNIPIGITPIQLFKLFGMYGNIQKIKIFHKNPENALIEYEDQAQALLAKINLNNCSLYKNNLLVNISQQDIATYVNTNDHNNFNNSNDLITDFRDSKDHRYKIMGSKNYNNIAAPSKVLHLSNLCEEKDEHFYYCLFQNYGKIIKMHELKCESKMYLMEMSNISESVNILMNFHNYDINGKFLKVSFSNYQKIKE